MKEKKNKRALKGILIGLGVAAVTISIAIIVFIYYFFTGGPAHIIKDAGLYEETIHSYEYAMDLGNNKIAYICTSFKDNLLSLKKIPKECLPNDYTDSLMNNTYANGGFNVYVTKKTDEYTLYDYGDKFN